MMETSRENVFFTLGGCEGAKGRNTLIFSDGREESLPGKTKVHVKGLVSQSHQLLFIGQVLLEDYFGHPFLITHRKYFV